MGPSFPFNSYSPREFTALGAGIAAHLTLIGFLSRVRPPVYGQVGAVLEHFTTELAGVVTAPGYQLLPSLRVK